MPADVETAVAWMRQKTSVDPARISLVGASIGANLALKVGAADPRIENVALLSPGLDYKGLLTEAAVEAYGKRPIFIAVSREDAYSSKSSLLLDASAKGKHFLQIYTGAGHGTKMFAKEPGLETSLQSWLDGTFEVEEDEE
jgi:acetyl esterase/lipase